LTAETGLNQEQLREPLGELASRGAVVRHADLVVHVLAFQQLLTGLHSLVSGFHNRNPLVAGISKEELREQAGLRASIFAAALAASTGGYAGKNGAVSEKARLEIAGDLVHLPGHGVVMKDEEAESRKIIEQAFASAGLKVPALKDVLAGLKIDKVRSQKIVTLLMRDRVLVKVSDNLVFHQSALSQLRQSLAAQKAQSPKIDIGRFKDLTGVSRKYAIPLLEYLDRERVTRRVGDERVIL
jgi:selenocysteine-specific elongation factor